MSTTPTRKARKDFKNAEDRLVNMGVLPPDFVRAGDFCKMIAEGWPQGEPDEVHVQMVEGMSRIFGWSRERADAAINLATQVAISSPDPEKAAVRDE